MRIDSLLKIGSALVLSAVLSACGTTGKTATGTLKGVAGSASSAYINALNGGIIGTAPGIKLSAADKSRALEAEYRALEAAPGGQAVTWSGSGVSGQVVAATPYQVGSQNCRQYSHTVTIGSQTTVAKGAACRNEVGSWTPLT